MNALIFPRLFWKEYRQQRGFWLSLATLAGLLMLVVLVLATVYAEPLPTDALFVIALGTVPLFALGSGATLFAGEHEAGTYGFLRAMPLSPAVLIASQVIFACASTLALQGVLWFGAMCLTGGALPDSGLGRLWAASCVASLELLAWGTLFSLVLTRPLTAAILAMAGASVGVHLIGPYLDPQPYQELGGNHYLAALPARFIFALFVLGVDVALGLRWFRDRTTAARLTFWETAQAAFEDAHGPQVGVAAAWSPFGTLVWQATRQSWHLLAAIGACYALVCLLTVRPLAAPSIGPEAFFLIPLGWLLGSCVFLADHRHWGFRFLAERGVGPRWVWASRQIVWFGMFLFWTVLTGGFFFAWVAASRSVAELQSLAREFGTCVGLAVLCYAISQVCSLAIRSGLVVLACSAFASLQLVGWAVLMWQLGVSLWLSVVPLPFFLLGATWLRSADWMLERTSLRARLKGAASLLLPLGVVFAAAATYRACEYPPRDPRYSVADFTRPAAAEERATAEQYRRAWQAISPPPFASRILNDELSQAASATMLADVANPRSDVRRWLDANRAALAESLAATKRRSCLLRDPALPENLDELRGASRLGTLIYLSGLECEAAGELDEALARYLAALRFSNHWRVRGTIRTQDTADRLEWLVCQQLPDWAARPAQTPALIGRAVSRLADTARDTPPRDDALKADFVAIEAVFGSDRANAERFAESLGLPSSIVALERSIQKWMPWEAVRFRRLATREFAARQQSWVAFAAALKAGRSWPNDLGPKRPQPEFYRHELSSGVLDAGLERCSTAFASELRQLTLRRATRLVLALQAWRLEHGRLPTSLNELAGKYLDAVPIDPQTGGSFVYFPLGAPQEFSRQAPFGGWGEVARSIEMPAGRPFVWCDRRTFPDAIDSALYVPAAEPAGEYPVEYGWTFPVPLAPADGTP